jgi:CRP/FNR family cyclic AMP-dependent transcriptional regulator
VGGEVKTGIFSRLSDEELNSLFSESHDIEYKRRGVIFTEGEQSAWLYYIVSGSVSVRVKDANGKDIQLARLGPKEVFGEMSAIDGLPRSASVLAREPTTLKILSRDKFLKAMSANPFIAQMVMEGLSARLRDADKLLRRTYARARARKLVSTTG